MKNLIYTLATVCILIITGCTKGDRLDHMVSSTDAPQQISNIKVAEAPGAATITYSLPNDPNLSYVKAVYEISAGVFREAKSSRYTDTLRLVGFGDVRGHEVKIYSVGKNEKASAPVVISVTPQIPPVRSVYETLAMIPTFGGVNLKFENETKAELVISLLVDSVGNNIWVPVTEFYTGASIGSFSVRGFDIKKRKFAVVLKDRWNNRSDTLVKEISPLFEKLLDRTKMKGLMLPNDAVVLGPSNTVDKLFDGKFGGVDPYGTTNASVFPQWFTIDLGQKAVLSRFKSFQRPAPFSYGLSAVKVFELYGSNNPGTDGSWTNWQLLGKFNSFKPSGLPYGQINDSDVNYAATKGEDFDFNELMPPYRYIRFKTLETYDMSGQVAIVEMSFWGETAP